MDSNYWSRKLQTRLSRRRAMIGTAGGALGAALLVACGGSSNKNSSPTATAAPSGASSAASGASGSSSSASGASGASGAKSSLLATPVDTSKQAVKGGTLGYFQNADPPSMDPFTSSSSLTLAFNEPAYQRLLRWSVGTPEKPPQTVEGDFAESYEMSPDGLTLTFKLRQGNKWDPRPPTNGRATSTEDIKWSWDAFVKGANPGRGSMAHSVNPQAPIESFSFPDDKTAVVKLAAPNSGILAMLTFNWYLSILPTELQDNNPSNFNRKFDMRGSGPFMLTKAQSSVGYEFQRNPNYWNADRPFLDGFSWPTIPESAQVQAQFKAGRIWYNTPPADLVLQLKNETPALQMYGISPFIGNLGGSNLNTSKLPDSPFNDVRIRYALSMLVDRDSYNEAFGNISKFEAAGIPMESGWDGFVPMHWPYDWLDPKAGKLGDASKYWQHNPDEAAKLLEAANFKGAEFDYTYAGSGGYSTDRYRQENEALIGMLNEGGLVKAKSNAVDFVPVFIPKYIQGKSKFEGVAYLPVNGIPDIDMHIFAIYMPGGRNDYVSDKSYLGDAYDLAIKHQQELDPQKGHEIAKQWQMAISKTMPDIIVQGDNEWTQFALGWPKLQNYQALVLQASDGAFGTLYENYWYDKTKDT